MSLEKINAPNIEDIKQDTDIISENNTIYNLGFVKIHRNILYWEWYKDNVVKILFLHFLLKANNKAKKWKGVILNPGEFITSLNHLSDETGLSLQQVRRGLNALKSTHEIAYKTTKHYSIITLKNWDKWQTKEHTEEQSDNKQTTLTKEYKNNIYNNNNNIVSGQKNFKIPTVEEIKKYCDERKNNIDVEQFYLYYSDRNWKNKDNKPVNWKLCVITWEKNDKKYNFNKGGDSIDDYNPNL